MAFRVWCIWGAHWLGFCCRSSWIRRLVRWRFCLFNFILLLGSVYEQARRNSLTQYATLKNDRNWTPLICTWERCPIRSFHLYIISHFFSNWRWPFLSAQSYSNAVCTCRTRQIMELMGQCLLRHPRCRFSEPMYNLTIMVDSILVFLLQGYNPLTGHEVKRGYVLEIDQ